MTFETFDQFDEDTRPDQKETMTKTNTMTNTFREHLQFMTIIMIWKAFANLAMFPQGCTGREVLQFCSDENSETSILLPALCDNLACLIFKKKQEICRTLMLLNALWTN